MAENKNTTENNKNSTIPENNEQLLERIMEKTQDEFLDDSEESSENTEDIKDTEETEGKEEGESFFFFVYIGGWDPERGFHCQAYEDDRACCRTDIHIYR